MASVGAVVAALLLAAPPAQATFHLIKIREVYPGSAAYPGSAYVELQMYASGQNLVAGHAVTVYNASNAKIGEFTFASDVANAASQQTILVGGSEVGTAFGVTPDLVAPGLSIPASGGAVCWAGSIDCTSWGGFSGTTASPSGSPADPSGIPAGEALRRTIAPSCPTLLEEADDTNSSATDFFNATPNPRNDHSAITETPCVGPTATIDSHPANPTNSTSAAFAYHASEAGSTFECKLDAAAFASCEASGIGYPGPLTEGSHTFEVRAHDASGTGAAASYTWTVDTTPPVVEIKTHPADPSPGGSAAFTYSSNETGSSFECSLEPGATAPVFSSCPSSGKSYPDAEHPAPLADGEWTFEVRATDRAGNLSTPEPFPKGTFSWTVNNSLLDTTPPETTILTKPPDPSESSTAAFTYESNEAGSRFECELDAAGFASCPASGVTYTGLADGSHSFEVRAIDPSGNVDPTPAGYSFSVVLTVPPEPSPAPAPPDTKLVGRLPARTHDRMPTFHFISTVPGASFQCSVDHHPFRSCRSPFTTHLLSFGRHLILVRAVANGLFDPTPASTRIKVVHRR